MRTLINPYILESTGAFTNGKRVDWNGSSQRAYTTAHLIGSATGAFSGWCEFDSLGSGSSSNMIFAFHGDCDAALDFCYLRSNGTNLQIIIKENNVVVFNATTSAPTLATGTLYHIFCQMTTGGIDLRVNDSAVTWSVSIGSAATQYTWFDIVDSASGSWGGGGADSRVLFGGIRNNSSDSNRMDGKMDEVSMFTQNLTNTEITNIYNGGTPTDLDGHDHLDVWYRFEDDLTDEYGTPQNLTGQGTPLTYVAA